MPREKKVFVENGIELSLYSPENLSIKWYLEWYDGTERRKSYKGLNRADTFAGRMILAEKRARELGEELAGLKSLHARKLDQYIIDIEGYHAESTWRNIKSIINKFAEWLGNRQITRQNVELYFHHLRKTRHATTYNQYRLWLGHAFDDLGMSGMLVNIKNLKTEKTPQRYFQPHQMRKLRNVIEVENPELWLYIQFAFYCFIRPGRELSQLKAGHIMMEDRNIVFRGQHGKNRKSQTVAIPDVFFPQLEFVYDMGPGEYLFPGRKDKLKPIRRTTMNEKHAEFLEELNFGPGYSLYSWRHTGAIMAIKQGISVNDLKIQMRHHSLAETDKYLRQIGVKDIGNLRASFPSIRT